MKLVSQTLKKLKKSVTFINDSFILLYVNGHSGLELPVPISNTEVKQAHVSSSTVLQYGKLGSLFTPFFKERKSSPIFLFLKILIKKHLNQQHILFLIWQ